MQKHHIAILAAAVLSLGAYGTKLVSDYTSPTQIEIPDYVPSDVSHPFQGLCDKGQLDADKFFQVLGDTLKVGPARLVGETPKDLQELIKAGQVVRSYRGLDYTFPLTDTDIDAIYMFPVDGSSVGFDYDWVHVFGVKGNCVVSYGGTRLGALNQFLRVFMHAPPIYPHYVEEKS